MENWYEMGLLQKSQLIPSLMTMQDTTSNIPDEELKSISVFIFTLLLGASKVFTKTFKAFIKPFEGQQRSVKIKILR